jgi:hypothetical protein
MTRKSFLAFSEASALSTVLSGRNVQRLMKLTLGQIAALLIRAVDKAPHDLKLGTVESEPVQTFLGLPLRSGRRVTGQSVAVASLNNLLDHAPAFPVL